MSIKVKVEDLRSDVGTRYGDVPLEDNRGFCVGCIPVETGKRQLCEGCEFKHTVCRIP
jgi:hypothetical protein